MTDCVHGFVRSAKDGKPITYANVMLIGTTRGAMTDQDGFFVIDGLQPRVYQLRAMMMGYKSVTVDSVTVNADPGCGRRIEIEMAEGGPRPLH